MGSLEERGIEGGAHVFRHAVSNGQDRQSPPEQGLLILDCSEPPHRFVRLRSGGWRIIRDGSVTSVPASAHSVNRSRRLGAGRGGSEFGEIVSMSIARWIRNELTDLSLGQGS